MKKRGSAGFTPPLKTFINLINIERHLTNLKSSRAGFTLIEMLIVMAIVALISGALILNFRESSRTKNTLQRGSLFIASSVRQAQVMSSASTKFSGQTPCGYGFHYDSSQAMPIIFFRQKTGQNCSQSRLFNPSIDIEHSKARMPDSILEIKAPIFKDIYFQPPDPKTYINNVDPYDPSAVETQLLIGFKDRPCSSSPGCKKVTVYPTGRIEISDYQ